MKKVFILYAVASGLLVVCRSPLKAQSVAINTDGSTANASSILDIKSITKGLLIPRMTTAQRTAIVSPVKGLFVFDTDINTFWFYNGTAWTQLSAGSNGWSLSGNGGTNPSTNFIGTTDAQPLRFRVNNLWAGEIHPTTGNIFLGINAGLANTNGQHNTALGFATLENNSSGNENVAIGDSSLYSQNGSVINVAVGTHSLYSNTSGNANTSIGPYALYSNTVGAFNIGIGVNALNHNISGDSNTAVGSRTLQFNNTGNYNTATGESALRNNTSGANNSAFGSGALYYNTGPYNSAFGSKALYNNTIGELNTANGFEALFYNSTGNNNTAIGEDALFFNEGGSGNTAVGYATENDNINLSNNTIIGANAHINASNSVVIGYASSTPTNNLALLGNTSTAFCGGYTNWTNYLSDGRFKKNVQENVSGLAFINQLRPVTYTLDIVGLNKFQGTDEYRKKINKSQREKGNMSSIQEDESDTQFKKSVEQKESIVYSGFIAQEVEEAAQKTHYNFSGLKKPQNDKDNYGLTYSDFVVPLVKGMQEQQQIIEKQQQQIDLLMKRIEVLEKK